MSQMITPLLFLLFLTNPVFSQLDELYFPGFNRVTSNMSLNGVAVIEKNGILRLTNNTQRTVGHAFYSSPIKFKNSSNGKSFSFSTAFAFTIVPENPRIRGHGFAFTISTSKELPGALPNQYLGLFNATDSGNFSNHLFAVEFDTVKDYDLHDINDNHVGIDINGLRSNISVPAASFLDNSAKEDLNLCSGRTIQAWVDYDSIKNLVEVRLSSSSKRPVSPILSCKADLSPIFKDYMYVGFSSSTGLLTSTHYILGWSFSMKGEAKKKKKADVTEAWELDIGPHRFSYQELKKATKNFRDEELLGFGGFGKVYKGTLPNSNTEIAVKRICHESKQGLKEFLTEIASIGRLRHRNLVRLLGWCRQKVLLEVVCGRKPIEPKALPEELILVDLVWDRWEKWCNSRCSGSEIEWPPMRQIVRYLEGEVALPALVGAPNSYDGKFFTQIRPGGRLEDHKHSYPVSSNLVSTWSFGGDSGDSDIEAGSDSALPFSGGGESK
ncbi:hypothetical protein OIU77_013519 [Salix suchowensis]|uniref:Protein kinase domain-containing protein n=1 Tax=Salix suchowensis TaxID=1278906 RepID=A0ABQ8ZUT6_9ROSI|nr:hypothetical protein OIU77_013519 [Salix suchowensis]